MTIHSEHPFLTPDDERDPVRRLRGRIGSTVALLTAGEGIERAGLTVSSYLVATGDPARVVALVDPDSDLLERFEQTGVAVLQLLEWRHRDLAEAFAGLLPSPGGPFKRGEWDETAWGPRLVGAGAWAGLRLPPDAGGEPRRVGWSVLVEAVVERVEIGDERAPLVHRRGRYVAPVD